MTELDTNHLDKTGKVVLDRCYNMDTPIYYYSAIEQLDYLLPQQAKPIFEKILDLLEKKSTKSHLKLVDIGSSYGVNGLLLKWRLELDEILSHYKKQSSQINGHTNLTSLDRDWLKAKPSRNIEIVGMDISTNALNYARKAQIIDKIINGNFEETALDPEQSKSLSDTDLIISTGCIGYVTHKTMTAVLNAMSPQKPWMAHFVLRMFPFDEMEAMLKKQGYKTLKSRHPVRQRRFASDLEREKALERLSSLSMETKELEQKGWYYADLFLSRPEKESDTPLPADLQKLFPAE